MIQKGDYIVNDNINAREALKKLELLPDLGSRNLFIINNKSELVGSITDGDIRRGLLNGLEISDGIELYMNRKFKFLNQADDFILKINEFRALDIELVPVLDDKRQVVSILDLNEITTIIPATAIIMAGGRGERLRPFTDTIPKPMLIVGSKPILEHNIDRLIKYGVKEIFISVKYLANSIMNYFGDGSKKGISIKYVEELEPLGTIGAISLIENISNENILVMNSDILSNIDFEDFFNCYKQNNSDICVASIPYNVNIPYAVLELEDEKIRAFSEKPTFTYYSSGGIYLINRNIINKIPYNTFYNATDLIQKLIDSKNKVVHYPLLNYWLDIGKHQDYIKAQDDIKHIKF